MPLLDKLKLTDKVKEQLIKEILETYGNNKPSAKSTITTSWDIPKTKTVGEKKIKEIYDEGNHDSRCYALG